MNKKYNRINVYFKESNSDHKYVLKRLEAMHGSRSEQIVAYLYQAMKREEEKDEENSSDIAMLIRNEVSRQLDERLNAKKSGEAIK